MSAFLRLLRLYAVAGVAMFVVAVSGTVMLYNAHLQDSRGHRVVVIIIGVLVAEVGWSIGRTRWGA